MIERYSLLSTTAWLPLCLATTVAAEISQSDRDLVKEVSQRLLAVVQPVPEFLWPPSFEVQAGDKVNASATLKAGENAKEKATAKVVVTEALLATAVQGEADRLAFVLAHELGHIVLRHVVRKPGRDATPFLGVVFTREQELAADQKGMEWTLAAGYSYRRTIKGIQRMMDLGLEYSSFEGLGVDHPSWKDRLTLLDKEQSSLWKVMSAFENGALFLLVEQYAAAERCFKAVTRDFPGCFEGWANLGYALLMQYCDALDGEDLRRFDVGHIVCGGFYRRPQSLESQVRGVNEELWWNAVGALREAVRLKPDLTLAKADLGVAYLLRPAGKDVGKATEYLQGAAEAAEADKALDPLARAAVLVNAGVADLTGGHPELCSQRLDKAERNGRHFAGQRPEALCTLSIAPALFYNRALLLASSRETDQRRRAADLLEKYLRIASPSSAWWFLANQRYADLCKEQGRTPKTQEQLRGNAVRALRPLTSVEVGRNIIVSLSESLSDAEERLGTGDSVPIVAGTNLVRIRYLRHGVDLLATDQVLAICLYGEAAPKLTVRASGLGTKAVLLSVGMAKEELERLLGDESYDFRQLTDPDVNYRFFRNLGLAVRVRKGGVEELVVVQIPERSVLANNYLIGLRKSAVEQTKGVRMMRLITKGVSLLLCLGAMAAAAQEPQPKVPAKSLAGLLKQSEMDYTFKDGWFRILVSVEGEGTLVLAQEAQLGDRPESKMAYLWCSVVEVPGGFKHPPAMLKKIAELNSSLLVGRVALDGPTGNIGYSSSFHLRTADVDILLLELYLAHFGRASLRKELLPFVKEQ